MTVANDEGEAEFHVKHRFTPLSAKLKESLAGWLAPQEAEAYQHKAENQKTKGILRYPQKLNFSFFAHSIKFSAVCSSFISFFSLQF